MKISIIAFLLFNFVAFGQHQVNFSVNGGLGKIALITNEQSELAVNTQIKDKYSTTVSLKTDYSYHFTHLFLETGLAYNFLQSTVNESFNVYNFFNPYEYFAITSEEKRKAHYITIPLLINAKIKAFSAGAGLYTSFHLTDSYTINAYSNGEPIAFQQGGNSLTKIDYGFASKAHYAINDKFGIQISANIGLKSVNKNNLTGAKYFLYEMNPAERGLKNRQFLLGITYKLKKIEKKIS